MPLNKLTYGGNDYDDEIISGVGGLSMDHAMVGETLTVDTLTVPLMTGDIPVRFLAADQGGNDFFFTADGNIFCVPGGSPAPRFTKNGEGLYYFGDELRGKYYLNEKKRTGPNENILRFYSAIWLLDQSDHVGGLYSSTTFGDIAAEIIGDVVEYTIDDDIAAIPVDKGYLPYAKRRANLQFLLMAYGATVKNASDGKLRITQLSDTVAGTFGESRAFIGGEVLDQIPATAVQVNEHNYIPTTETVDIYNDSTLETIDLVFSEPYHDLHIEGGTILAQGVNYCSFTGAGAVALTGKKHNHMTRVVTAGTPPTGSPSDVVRRAANNTMIVATNSADVAQRIFEYQSVKQIIRQEVVFGTERPGDVVNVVDPNTGETATSCLKPMNISFGFTENRAICDFLVNYKPSGATAGFEHYVLLTGSGVWIAPDKNGDGNPYRARYILVGAANGGDGGDAGHHSVPGTTGKGGDGGEAGEAGQGGFIFEINVTVTPGASYSFNCGIGGIGGTGGVPNYSNPGQGAEGQVGTATTLGSLSSAMGRLFPYGYLEPKSGLTFAANGAEGVDGGAGDSIWAGAIIPGPDVIFGGVTYNRGNNGADLVAYGFTFSGGGGGGAAVGSSGGNGEDAAWVTPSSVSYPKHGDGGAGANANAGVDGSSYGCGGSAGHGGGGGGFALSNLAGQPPNSLNGNAGPGGSGGDGGAGGDGCIVIYY